MQSTGVLFVAPRVVEVRQEQMADLKPDQVLVRTLISAISPGTEMLLYRGEFPADLPLDENLESLAGQATYPVKYGYSAIGEVIERGEAVDSEWIGKRVFAFQPHVSHFVVKPDALQVIPQEISEEDAAFLPNMETAVNFVMDGRPLIGENVILFGQGIVGLLTTALLAQYPLNNLITVDPFAIRRRASLDLGANISIESSDAVSMEQGIGLFKGSRFPGADLIYELTGNPQVLNHALEVCRFNGRIVIGSWYGKKQADLNLGGWFHRSRIQLISSQVSSINPEFSARWDKDRRFQVAWEMLSRVKPSRLITHRIPIREAGEAYRLVDQQPGETIQIILTY